jgi:U3 small nucleolar RNA-associated protein 14
MTTTQDIIKEYQRVSKLLISIEDDIDNNRAEHLTAMEKTLLESHKDLLRYYMKMLQKRKNEAKAREEADEEAQF